MAAQELLEVHKQLTEHEKEEEMLVLFRIYKEERKKETRHR